MRKRFLWVMTLSAALFSAGLPARAAHTSGHAEDEIWDIVAQAEQDMDQVVSGFEDQIAGMGTHDEVVSAEDAADDAIKTIWDEAMISITNLTKPYHELGQVGGKAKQQVQDARQTSRDLISALADDWTPPAATTTTTPATTTTNQPPSKPGKGSGTPPPGPKNGDGPPESPGSPKKTTPTPANQDPPAPTPQIVPSSPSSSQPSSSLSQSELSPDAAPGASLILASQMSHRTLGPGPEAARSVSEADASGATAKMAEVLETVLPPAIVDLVLSPLLVLEILVRTTVEGGLSVTGPLALFAISALGIIVYDRSSKRSAILG